MKKIALLVLASMLTLTTFAQQSIGGSVNKPKKGTALNAEDASSSYWFRDIGVTFNPDEKRYGLSLGGDFGTCGYGMFSASLNDSNLGYALGIGVQKRVLLADNLVMLQGRLYPYATYYNYEVINSKGNTDYKSKFSYGAEAALVGGLKLISTKKGTNHYLTVGYYMSAAEFKFDYIEKSGNWMIGWTIAGLD